jgi:hypothetical protein
VAELDNATRAMIENISIGGICLKTSHSLNINSSYTIRLSSSSSEKNTVNGVVVWSYSPDNDKESGVSSYEAGLKFVGLNDSLRNYLERFIENLFV